MIRYDADTAGQNATIRVWNIKSTVSGQSLNCQRRRPDDYIRKYGRTSFELADGAKTFVEYQVSLIEEDGLKQLTRELSL